MLMLYIFDIIQDSIWENSSVLIDYIELSTRLNQFEMLVNNIKTVCSIKEQCCSKQKKMLREKHVNIDSKRLELII